MPRRLDNKPNSEAFYCQKNHKSLKLQKLATISLETTVALRLFTLKNTVV